MEKNLHDLVRERAGRCCEYCRFPEWGTKLPFYLDYVVAADMVEPIRIHDGAVTFRAA